VSVLPGRILRVSGVGDLRVFTHRSMTDRLEAASWAAAALATSGRITVHGADQADLMTFLNLYRRAGGDFDVADDAITFYRAGDLVRPLAFETDVHPGFMTDWHPPLVTALTQADGVSVLHETVFEDRLGYTGALNQLGANIQTFRECLGPMPCRFGSRNWIHSAVVIGPSRLRGGELTVPDLRAGCAYVLAALAADGPSTIYGASYIDRGYENFRAKLADLGAKLL
ncbi:MAG: UDP-N-acetylglucosamine 1-carboxyvinyltransferase, partial [Acidimicrobiales bacterium]